MKTLADYGEALEAGIPSQIDYDKVQMNKGILAYLLRCIIRGDNYSELKDLSQQENFNKAVKIIEDDMPETVRKLKLELL